MYSHYVIIYFIRFIFVKKRCFLFTGKLVFQNPENTEGQEDYLDKDQSFSDMVSHIHFDGTDPVSDQFIKIY